MSSYYTFQRKRATYQSQLLEVLDFCIEIVRHFTVVLQDKVLNTETQELPVIIFQTSHESRVLLRKRNDTYIKQLKHSC